MKAEALCLPCPVARGGNVERRAEHALDIDGRVRLPRPIGIANEVRPNHLQLPRIGQENGLQPQDRVEVRLGLDAELRREVRGRGNDGRSCAAYSARGATGVSHEIRAEIPGGRGETEHRRRI